MSLANYLNALSAADCRAALARCCTSPAWVDAMLATRPFTSDEHVLASAERIWQVLKHEDWHEAFAAHPRIGDVASLRARFADTRDWASREQAGVDAASEATLRRLAEANDEYFDKFGYIFIVCATGKSADEMLALLEARLLNEPASELTIAADEQLKITRLRLKNLASAEQ